MSTPTPKRGPRRSKLPTVGFVSFCTVVILTLTFFAWGFTRPELDRVWALHHHLKIGTTTRLDPEDRALLARNIKRHPALASALLGGGNIGIISARNWQGWLQVPHALLIRTPESAPCTALKLAVHTSAELLPYHLDVQGSDWEKRVDITATGPYEVELPAVTNPELISVRFEGQDFPTDPSRIGVKLEIACGKEKAALP